MKGSDEMVGV